MQKKRDLSARKMKNDKSDIFEKLTSLIDNEDLDENLKSSLLQKIDEDAEYNFEYNIQRSAKKVVQDRVRAIPAPDHLRARIINSIKPEVKSPKFSLQELFNPFINRPAAAITAAVIFTIAVIFFQFKGEVDFTETDMFAQAEANFDDIMAGKLIPQKLCNSSKEVKDFFNNAGVKYATIVPEFPDWNILGAVVSNEHGEKLAHHVYTDNDGHVIYLYQVCEDQLSEEKLVQLSPYLLNKCKTKRFIKFTSDTHSTYLFLHNNNIFALVTNDDDSKIEQKFIAGLSNSPNF